MALNSDRDGFLIPDAPLRGDDLSQGIRGIKRDTGHILSLMRKRVRVLDRARIANPNSRTRVRSASESESRPTGARSSESVPRGAAGGGAQAAQGAGTPRDSRGRFTRQPGADVAGAVRQLTRQQGQQAAERARTEEAQRTRDGDPSNQQTRDARGRFGAGGGGAGGGDGDDKKGGFFARLKDAMSNRGGGDALGDVDKVDPAIEAAHEIQTMIGGALGGLKSMGELGRAVIGRGFGGSKDRATPWYKKMLQQLKLMRRDDGEFHRAELRALNEQGAGGGGSGDGFFMSAFKLLFGPLGAALIGAAALAWATMGDKISGAWSSFVATVSQKWDAAVKTFIAIWEPIAKFFADKFGIVTNAVGAAGEKANTAIKAVTGVDVKAGTSKAAEAVSRASDGVAEKAGSWLEKVSPGYRHTATFDGIKGGDDLRKYGSYTDAEAEKVRQLKTSGANTTANLKGGMPAAIRDKIIAQSKAAGEDPELMLKMAAIESGGNPNAVSSTGAIGVMQMTGKTASGLGIKDRFNEDQNIAGGIKLAKEGREGLTKAKLPVTAENLYMMHQLGPVAAKEVIRGAESGKQVSELSADTQSAMAKNYGAGSKTAAEYIGKNKAALDSRYAAVVGPDAASKVAAVPGSGPQAAAGPAGKPGASPAAGAPGAPGASPAAGKPGTPGASPAAGRDAVSVTPTAGAAPAVATPGAAGAAPTLAGNGAAGAAGRDATVAPSVGAAPVVATPGAVPAMANQTAPARPIVLGAGVAGRDGMGALQPTVVQAAGVTAAVPVAMGVPAPAALAGAPNIPSVAVASQVAPPPAARADVPIPLSSKAPLEVTVRNDKLAGQDVKDRRLAHIATGGMAAG